MDKNIIISRLEEFAAKNKVLSIIGLAKNAGKTTVMNYIINHWKNKNLCVTSIGLDGEAYDTIRNHEKPRIKLYKGMYVITAINCIETSTAQINILAKTNISTPLGEIIIGEINKEGLVLIAGPSTKHEMKYVIELVKKYNPFLTLIDGALYRISSASRAISEGIIFAVGASYHSDINKVVKDSKKVIDHFRIETHNMPISIDEKIYEKDFIYCQKQIIFLDKPITDSLKNYITGVYNELFINLQGAFTENIANTIINKRNKFKKITIIVKDASHIIISPQTSEKLKKIGVLIKALRQIEIVFIAYNPVSPYGYKFDDLEFKTKLIQELNLEPVNVMKDWK